MLNETTDGRIRTHPRQAILRLKFIVLIIRPAAPLFTFNWTRYVIRNQLRWNLKAVIYVSLNMYFPILVFVDSFDCTWKNLQGYFMHRVTWDHFSHLGWIIKVLCSICMVTRLFYLEYYLLLTFFTNKPRKVMHSISILCNKCHV